MVFWRLNPTIVPPVGGGGGGGGGTEETVTLALAFADPPAPVHVSVYVAVAVGVTACVPPIALVPVQPFEAVQLVALVELQVSVADAPAVIEVGFAESETVGAGTGGCVVDFTRLSSTLQPSTPES